jgi:hypothetical protein
MSNTAVEIAEPALGTFEQKHLQYANYRAVAGTGNVYTDIGGFFSKMAVVTFGSWRARRQGSFSTSSEPSDDPATRTLHCNRLVARHPAHFRRRPK